MAWRTGLQAHRGLDFRFPWQALSGSVGLAGVIWLILDGWLDRTAGGWQLTTAVILSKYKDYLHTKLGFSRI